jgi:hypothetical protein
VNVEPPEPPERQSSEVPEAPLGGCLANVHLLFSSTQQRHSATAPSSPLTRCPLVLPKDEGGWRASHRTDPEGTRKNKTCGLPLDQRNEFALEDDCFNNTH